MGRMILVSGGARSGKSSFAERLLASEPEKVYIATCTPLDDEMRSRIAKHRERRGDSWKTLEVPLDIADAIKKSSGASILVDCLTLWINNLLCESEKNGRAFGEEEMSAAAERVAAAAECVSGTVVFVINEVGLGIVPDNPLSRNFRDCSGRCAQIMASHAAEVYFMTCGIPLKIK